MIDGEAPRGVGRAVISLPHAEEGVVAALEVLQEGVLGARRGLAPQLGALAAIVAVAVAALPLGCHLAAVGNGDAALLRELRDPVELPPDDEVSEEVREVAVRGVVLADVLVGGKHEVVGALVALEVRRCLEGCVDVLHVLVPVAAEAGGAEGGEEGHVEEEGLVGVLCAPGVVEHLVVEEHLVHPLRVGAEAPEVVAGEVARLEVAALRDVYGVDVELVLGGRGAAVIELGRHVLPQHLVLVEAVLLPGRLGAPHPPRRQARDALGPLGLVRSRGRGRGLDRGGRRRRR